MRKPVPTFFYYLLTTLCSGCSYPIFPQDVAESEIQPTASCLDGLDNDQNGLTDCEDPACSLYKFCDHFETVMVQCSDGMDNDENGLIDCEDPGCRAYGYLCPKASDGCHSGEAWIAPPDAPEGCYTAIRGADDFRLIRGRPNGLFVLTNDIELIDGTDFPIPNFSGTLLGNGHKLSGQLSIAPNHGQDDASCSLFESAHGASDVPADGIHFLDIEFDLDIACHVPETAKTFDVGGLIARSTLPTNLRGLTGSLVLNVIHDAFGVQPLASLHAGGIIGHSDKAEARLSDSSLVTHISLHQSGFLPTETVIGGIIGSGIAVVDNVTLEPTLTYHATGGRDSIVETGYALTFGGLIGTLHGGRLHAVTMTPALDLHLDYPIRNYSLAQSMTISAGGLGGILHQGDVQNIHIESETIRLDTDLGLIPLEAPIYVYLGGGLGQSGISLDTFHNLSGEIAFDNHFRRPMEAALGGITGRQTVLPPSISRTIRFTGNLEVSGRLSDDPRSRLSAGGILGHGEAMLDTVYVDASLSVATSHARVTHCGGIFGCLETSHTSDILMLNNAFSRVRFTRRLDDAIDAVHTYPYSWGGLAGAVQNGRLAPVTNLYLANAHIRTEYDKNAIPDMYSSSSKDIVYSGCIGNAGGHLMNIFTSTKLENNPASLPLPFVAIGGGIYEKDTYYPYALFENTSLHLQPSQQAEGYSLETGEPLLESGEPVLERMQRTALMGAVALSPMITENQKCNTWQMASVDGVYLPVPSDIYNN